MPSAESVFFGFVVWTVICVALGVWIARWVFRVNKIVGLLEGISAKIDDLPKKPVEWNDIMPPQKKEEDLATRYGPKI